jgi:pseudaminic acid synthase
MLIGTRAVGPGDAPFIIAEMSGNHNQSLERALQIVDAAAQAGAHALKIQTYTADTMTLPSRQEGFVISDLTSLWHGRSLHDLYHEAHTPWEWHAPILQRASELGLVAFSTPFDESAVEFLEALKVPCYKIASFENTDIPLIQTVAATGKPLIISTGLATIAELDATVRAARAAGCRDLILLKCTSAYPAEPTAANITTIPHLRELFACEVGLSDHTAGIGVAVASVALGATVIEKHFTLCRADGGVDAAFSLEPAELRCLVDESLRAWQSLGKVSFGVSPMEQKSLAFRRSLYFTADVAAGSPITRENVRAIRPGFGLAPLNLTRLLGCTVRHDIKAGTPVSWDVVLGKA